jgi:hypothetical protein
VQDNAQVNGSLSVGGEISARSLVMDFIDMDWMRVNYLWLSSVMGQVIELRYGGETGDGYTFTFPKTPGESGQALVTDGSGTTSWESKDLDGEIITGPTTAEPGHTYIADNISRVVITLPVTCAVGKSFKVIGKGAGGWKIAQNSGQTIHLDALASATGTGGYIQSDDYRSSIQIMCITADSDWKVAWNSGGKITIEI